MHRDRNSFDLTITLNDPKQDRLARGTLVSFPLVGTAKDDFVAFENARKEFSQFFLQGHAAANLSEKLFHYWGRDGHPTVRGIARHT
jgi:hypothetical protein